MKNALYLYYHSDSQLNILQGSKKTPEGDRKIYYTYLFYSSKEGHIKGIKELIKSLQERLEEIKE